MQITFCCCMEIWFYWQPYKVACILLHGASIYICTPLLNSSTYPYKDFLFQFYIYIYIVIIIIKSSRWDCKALSDSSFLSQVRTSLLPTCALDAPQILPLKKQKKCSRKGRKAGFECILVLFWITIIPFHTSYTLT
jgi:hypothetical protein